MTLSLNIAGYPVNTIEEIDFDSLGTWSKDVWTAFSKIVDGNLYNGTEVYVTSNVLACLVMIGHINTEEKPEAVTTENTPYYMGYMKEPDWPVYFVLNHGFDFIFFSDTKKLIILRNVI